MSLYITENVSQEVIQSIATSELLLEFAAKSFMFKNHRQNFVNEVVFIQNYPVAILEYLLTFPL